MDRRLKVLLLGWRKSDVQGTARPGRPRRVDLGALFLRDLHPRIAVGRMQPAAAEIERESRGIGHRPGAAAEPRAGFDDETIDRSLVQAARRGDAGRTAADDN